MHLFVCYVKWNVQQELMRDMRFWPKHFTTRQHFFFMKLQVELMLADKKYNILLIVCSQVQNKFTSLYLNRVLVFKDAQ